MTRGTFAAIVCRSGFTGRAAVFDGLGVRQCWTACCCVSDGDSTGSEPPAGPAGFIDGFCIFGPKLTEIHLFSPTGLFFYL